jgi:hypothetical protein
MNGCDWMCTDVNGYGWVCMDMLKGRHGWKWMDDRIGCGMDWKCFILDWVGLIGLVVEFDRIGLDVELDWMWDWIGCGIGCELDVELNWIGLDWIGCEIGLDWIGME